MLSNMNKSKFDTIYQHLTDYKYDYDRVRFDKRWYSLHVYKWGKDHLITAKLPKEEHQHFIYLVRKFIYESQQTKEAPWTTRPT